jgi:hypothetical protein
VLAGAFCHTVDDWHLKILLTTYQAIRKDMRGYVTTDSLIRHFDLKGEHFVRIIFAPFGTIAMSPFSSRALYPVFSALMNDTFMLVLFALRFSILV